jgi:diguanylate cyclase (GGDEF)-like protein
MGQAPPLPVALRSAFVAVTLVLTVNQAHALLWPESHQGLAARLVYDLAILVVSGLALARAARPAERGPWLLVALGVTAWSCGDVFWTLSYWSAEDVPYPSPADAGYLLLPPLVLAGLLRLLRGPRGLRSSTLWADGVAAALAIAAVGAALVVAPLLDTLEGNGLVVATNLAYPLGDLVLLAAIVGALAGQGWQVQRRAGLLAVGVVLFYAADSLYLVGTAQGTYTWPSWIDTGWWAGLLLIALAAWQPPPRPREEADDERRRLVVMPLLFALVATGVLVCAALRPVHWIAVALAAVSLLAVMVRLMLTFNENVAMLRVSRSEARTDPLTGLGNRRALARDLARRLGAEKVEPFVLVLFDLDGFKHYNDTFGHPAGDALLQRLGAKLEGFVAGRGRAFRMGGDEFCALLPSETMVKGAALALCEEGEGFRIGTSHGHIALPLEVDDASEAIRLADQRLYANKHARRGSPERQTADALLQALNAHTPELGAHVDGVAALAEATARRLGLDAGDVERVRHAAELHDIGKLGVPASILAKPDSLAEDEWQFIRRHTLIGERILSAAPALLPIARLVRATHERWDGTGYPDGKAATAIPLGARIVAVADAFEAMVSERPYSPPMDPAEALAELQRCAGTQFDPEVVEAFTAAWTQRTVALAA